MPPSALAPHLFPQWTFGNGTCPAPAEYFTMIILFQPVVESNEVVQSQGQVEVFLQGIFECV
jgi:hypothetical protein